VTIFLRQRRNGAAEDFIAPPRRRASKPDLNFSPWFIKISLQILPAEIRKHD